MAISRRMLLGSACVSCWIDRAAAQSIMTRLSLTPSQFDDMFHTLVAEFEAANPRHTIRIEGSYRDQSDQFPATLRQALVGDLPDLTFQGYAYIPLLKARGLTVLLEPLLAQDKAAVEMGLAGPVLSTCRVDGQVHGLGVGMSFPVAFINAELARRAGADPDRLPNDWDGLIALARAMAKLGDGTQGGFFQYGSGGNWTWIALIESLGGRMVTEDGKPGFAGPEGLRALEIIQAFGALGQASYDVSQDQARAVFGSGILGMIIDSSSSLAMFEASAAGRFRVVAAPLPLAADGRIPAAGTGTVLHARDPARQQAAWAFMRFASGLAGQTIVGRMTGYTPANPLALAPDGPLASHYAQHPASRAGNLSAAHAAPWFAFPGDNTVKVADVIKGHLRDLVLQTTTPVQTQTAILAAVRDLVPTMR